MAAVRKLHVRHLDVKCAYLNGNLEEELYLEQQQGFQKPEQEEKVLTLNKSLYGLKQAARAWNRTVTEVLQKLGFQRSKADMCLYMRQDKERMMYVFLYVDDLLVAGVTPEATKCVSKQLREHFQIKDLGDVHFYLGIQVDQDGDGSFLLEQSTKIQQLLEKQGMIDCKPASTPMETGFPSAITTDSKELPNNHEYRRVVGSLLYLATVTRPDVALAVGYLCRNVEKPTERNWQAAKRVMRYLKATQSKRLCLSSSGSTTLECFVDADWAGDRRDRKSTSGYLFIIGCSTIAWSSRKQSTVALSSTEAEYVAASQASRELVWLRQLLHDLGEAVKGATMVHEDNQGCIKLVTSERCGQRTKHIDIYHHYLRDLRDQVIKMQYCPTGEMATDIFTKPLCRDIFSRCCDKLGLRDI